MTTEYSDPRIKLNEDGLSVSGYYLPWGSKRIPLDSIRAVRRVNMGLVTGKARLWGTANPRYWASLDPKRPSKQVAFIVNNGHAIRPFITPDDPDAFESALCCHANVAIERGNRSVII
jgi:hypothetical protein